MKKLCPFLLTLFIAVTLFAQNDIIYNEYEVDQKPILKDCNKWQHPADRYNCSEEKLAEFLNISTKSYKTIISTSIIIEADGTVSDFEVLDDIEDAVLDDIEDLVYNLPLFYPGQHKGKNVPVSMIINIKSLQEVYEEVEEMPRPYGEECEFIKDEKEKKDCAYKELMMSLYGNIRYPAYARENGIQGTVIISFIVETNGEVSNIKIEQDIGGGCGEESLRVANLMLEQNKRWIPGRQDGKVVRVLKKFPLSFKLK